MSITQLQVLFVTKRVRKLVCRVIYSPPVTPSLCLTPDLLFKSFSQCCPSEGVEFYNHLPLVHVIGKRLLTGLILFIAPEW